jgi:molybdopterin-guanine dinucleotide biosynthesis protein A
LEVEILSSTTLALIAGGAGSRMGMPKAMLRVDGQSILAWLLQRWRWPGPTMLVTAPAIPILPDARAFDRHVVDPEDGLGPLRGVLTALQHVRTPRLVVAAVDMPFVDRSQLAWLAESLSTRAGCLGLMCRTAANAEVIIEPFPAAFLATAVDAVAARLASGRRSIHGLCDDERFATVPVPTDWRPETWTNLNDPAALSAFEASRSGRLHSP